MRVVIYKGQFQYDVVNDFSYSIGNILENKGAEVIYVDLTSVSLRDDILKAFQQPVDFVLAFNGIGYELMYEDQSLYDFCNTVFVIWLVDHPAHLYERILAPIKNKIVICIDDTHVDYIEKHLDASIITSFIPHAVRQEPYYFNLTDKIYNLVFAGHIGGNEKHIEKIIELEQKIPNLRQIILQELSIEGNINLGNFMSMLYKKQPILEIWVAQNPNLDSMILHFVDRYIRTIKREHIIQGLLDEKIQIDFFGTIPENHVFLKSPYFNYHGILEFNEMKSIFKQSKLVLNVLPNFPNGGHERIFTSMICGALPVTDTNVYIEQHLSNILSFNFKDFGLVAERIRDLLENEQQFEKLIWENYQLVSEQHIWEIRLEELLYVLEAAKQYFNN